MQTVRNENYESRIRRYLERQEFMKHLGFVLSDIAPGETAGYLDVKTIHKQQKGLLHGGVISTMADLVAGFAAYTLVPDLYNVVTGELKVSFLNPGITDKVYARGWVLKSGKKISFCEAEIWEEYHGEKRLIAKATTSMVILQPDDFGSKNIGSYENA